MIPKPDTVCDPPCISQALCRFCTSTTVLVSLRSLPTRYNSTSWSRILICLLRKDSVAAERHEITPSNYATDSCDKTALSGVLCMLVSSPVELSMERWASMSQLASPDWGCLDISSAIARFYPRELPPQFTIHSCISPFTPDRVVDRLEPSPLSTNIIATGPRSRLSHRKPCLHLLGYDDGQCIWLHFECDSRLNADSAQNVTAA